MPAKRFALSVAVLLGTGAIAVGAVVIGAHARTPAGTPTTAAKVATTTVTRTDLSDTRTLPGTLGYGSAAPVTGHGNGVVTGLAAAGNILTRGKSVYRADDRPVALFYGTTPLFRTLSAPSGKAGPLRGRDVTVVADNLQALGYDIGYRPADTDGRGATYTASLAAAVKRWEQHVGMKATGTLGVGQIVVLPGAVRVNAVQGRLGDPVQETLLSVTSTSKTVTVPVEADDAASVTKEARVDITLPDDRTVPGKVTAVSQSVQSGDAQEGNQNEPPTLDVSVRPLHSPDVASLDSAPVQVRFSTDTRKGVLAVPVGALVALKEGGYALQRPDGTLVAVTTGLFADGRVEVSGVGVTPGMRVETAS